MIDYEKEFESPAYAARQITIAKTFKYVYGWMAAGLALSGLVAWYTYDSGLYLDILGTPWFFGCIIAEFALVFGISFLIRKIPAFMALVMFAAYAALNGLTLSYVFVFFDLALIQNVFFITAGMFAGLALYGTFTKSDLSSVGSLCGMALWGIIIASLVNMFVGSGNLDWIISFVAILVFTGLTMYDAQKIREIAAEESSMGQEALIKVGVVGALTLYLDFINIFLHLLELFGSDD